MQIFKMRTFEQIFCKHRDSWFGNQGLSGGLTQDGELYVWGTDRTGLIGVEGYSLPAKAKVQDVKFKKFSIGSADYDSRQWIIGLESNNKFYGGGGYNPYGQTGIGSTEVGSMKEGLNSLDELIHIDTATFGNISAGMRPDGTVVVWGLNNYGQLGDGSNINAINPATVGGLSNSILRLGGGTVSDETSSKAVDKIPGIITLAENEKLQIDKLKITKSSGFNLISTSDPVNIGNLEFNSMDASIATVNSDGVIKPNQNKRYGSTKIIVKDTKSG